MKNRLWMILLLTLVVPALLFNVSCAKKVKSTPTSGTEQTVTDQKTAEDDAAAAAKRKAEEEEALREQALKAAQEQFINEDVHYDYDSAAIKDTEKDILNKKAQFMKDNANVATTVEGHCDERGTAEYNIALGEKRANAAKAFLVDLGIDGSRLEAKTFGKEQPIDPGHTEEAWAKNRRAHFVIK